MGLTLTEKILSRAARKVVAPGDVVEAAVDVVAFHDLTGHHVVEVLKILGVDKVPNPDQIVVALDHLAPPPDVRSAEIHKVLREFAKKALLRHFHDVGEGILHQVLAERYVLPGQVVVTADSHGTTLGALGAFAQGMGASDVAAAILTGRTWLTVPRPFKLTLTGSPRRWVTGKEVALELLRAFGADFFNGMALEVFVQHAEAFPMDYRLTVANMGAEMNADAVMFVPDGETARFLEEERGVKTEPMTPDPGARYEDEYALELDKLDFLVAAPPTVDNVKCVTEVAGLEVDYVFIGSCTNGRLSDLMIAANLMKGRKVRCRCIVVPASRRVFLKALELGYIQTLVEAGCVVTCGTCGPCIGGHFGVAGPGEIVVSTSNRNFVGRMGSPEAKIYLSGPAVAAATAVLGRIAGPGDLA